MSLKSFKKKLCKVDEDEELLGKIIFKDTYCCIGAAMSGNQHPNVICARNDYLFAWMNYSTGYGWSSPKQQICIAKTGSIRAENLCAKLGTLETSLNLITPYGHNSNGGLAYKHYLMK